MLIKKASVIILAALLPLSAQAAAWRVEQTLNGDLNGDGIADRVTVERLSDTAPRRLTVALSQEGRLKNVARTTDLLPPKTDAENNCLQDPLEDGEVAVRKGVLRVKLNYWFDCGTYSTYIKQYVFRWDGKGMRLIGEDEENFNRASGEKSSYSINYSTGKRRDISGANEFDAKANRPKTVWRTLPPQPAYYLGGKMP
ncbi:MAG: hypothetical protein Q4D82_04130 [Neisseria sp.]|nr:hypothetical protein [Neisseria sp.]